MTIIRHAFVLSCLLFAASPAQAQFLLRVLQDNTIIPVSASSALTMTAPSVGKAVTISILATYQGNTRVRFARSALLGPADFSYRVVTPPNTNAENIELTQNQTVTLEVVYQPKTSARLLAQLDLPFTEKGPAPATPTSPVPADSNGLLSFLLLGTAPDFGVSSVFASDQNVVGIPAGGTVTFPQTVIGTTTTATILVSNRGSGPGRIRSVVSTGESFQLANVPILPTALPVDTVFSFQIRYRPRSVADDVGNLRIEFDEGNTTEISLRGSSIQTQFRYEALPLGSDSQTVGSGQAVQFADTKLGERSKLFFRISNISQTDASIGAITTVGAAYTVADLPVLPVVLAPQASALFSVEFAPQVPEVVAGRLRIGSDFIELSGKGIGSRLVYSYRAGALATLVAPGGTISFPVVDVGQNSSVELAVQNTGTAPTAINSVGIIDGTTPSAFSLVSRTAPLTLQPGETHIVSARFQPKVSGLSTAQLKVNDALFVLSGFADQLPTPLQLSVRGVSQAASLEQVIVTLEANRTYPVDVKGKLSLRIESNIFGASEDPGIQFSTGGRTVEFTLAANSRQVQFASGITELRLQTGTTAGTLVVGAELTSDASDISVSPLRITVGPAVPVLVNARISGRTASSFNLELIGYTNTHQLTTLDINFSAVAGFNVPPKVSLDLSKVSEFWFKAQASSGFGGQFTLTIPFNLTGTNLGTNTSLIDGIKSVSAVVSNQNGVSNTVSINLQ